MSYQFGHIDPDERLDYVDEQLPEEEMPPRRHLPAAAVALAVMAIFAGGLWFAYHEGTRHPAYTATTPDNIPLIRADPDPVKVKPPPEKVGGMEVPNKDNPLYGARVPPVEKLLPPPEAPVARPLPPPQAPAPPAAAAPPAPPPVAAAPKAPPKPGPAEAALPAGIRVQLASLRSAEAARDEWQRLKRENADLLGKLTAVAVRADLGERGIYYKIEVGPLASREAALRLCGELKGRDLGCQLVR
jgi:cell division septation protein DedD